MSSSTFDMLDWTVRSINKEHPDLDVRIVAAGKNLLVTVRGVRGMECPKPSEALAYVNGLADGLERFYERPSKRRSR